MKRLCCNCLDTSIRNCKLCSIGQKKIEEYEYNRLIGKVTHKHKKPNSNKKLIECK